MADSAVAITAGTGTNVDTRTEGTNGNHRQVIVIGDPATNAGVAPVDATNGLSVTLTTAIPAGSAAIGKLAANSGVDIGDVDVTSSVLPTGASTAAKQPALGTAGTASTDVITVQGIASMTALKVDGSGVTQPVSGTVAVTNAALTELAAAINSDKLDVNIASSSISVGGTAAADDADFTAGTTPATPVAGVYESTPTSVTDGDLGTVGITSGRRLKTSATIDAALPTGTNGIGKLTANSGVDIGDVDVTSSALPTGAATSAKQDTQITAEQAIQAAVELIDDVVKAEDVASAGADKGLVINAVRQDTPANSSGTDGDYEPLRMAGGRLWVDASGKTLTVDGSGVTQPVSNAGLTELAAAINSSKVDVNIVSSDVATGGTSAADDADFTAGTTTGTPAMGIYESTPTSVTDGDLGTVGITSGRRLKTSATIDAALPAGTNAIGKLAANSGVDIGDVTIDNATLAVTQSGTWDEVGINDSGNSITVDYATTGSGTATGALRVELANNGTGVLATVGAVTAITNALPAGTNAIGKLAANSGVDIGDVDITSIAAGNNNIGDVDVASLPALAAGTNAIGKLVVQDTDTNGNTNHAQKYYTNSGAVTDGIIWSPAAGKRWHVLTLYINVSAAATVTLEDDLAGGDSAVWKGELAANSGVVLTYDKDHAFASTEDAADLIITTSAGNVYVQAVGYEV